MVNHRQKRGLEALMKRNITSVVSLGLVCTLGLSACGGQEEVSQQVEPQQGQSAQVQATAQESDDEGVFEFVGPTANSDDGAQKETKRNKGDGVDYLVLVNKTHELDKNWEDEVDLVEVTNSRGSEITVERAAAEAFEDLQKELKKQDVIIDLNSCYRSRKKQQELVDQFTQEYGSDYVEKYVAKAGHSEHETGLALDVIPIVDGVEMLTNEEMLAQKDLWKTVHTIMPKYGFILRYMPDKDDITGYEYEPWHLRYVGTPDAQKITDSGQTLEEYLGETASKE